MSQTMTKLLTLKMELYVFLSPTNDAQASTYSKFNVLSLSTVHHTGIPVAGPWLRNSKHVVRLVVFNVLGFMLSASV